VVGQAAHLKDEIERPQKAQVGVTYRIQSKEGGTKCGECRFSLE
jgi:hypothetical protein